MIIFFALIFTTQQTVIYEFNANSYNFDGWYNNHNYKYVFQTCGQKVYLQLSSYDSRIFENLEPHSHIQIDGEYFRPSLSQYNFYLDFNSFSFNVQNSKESECGLVLQTFSSTILHNKRTAWVEIYHHYLNNFGLIKLKLSIIKCQYGCAACIKNDAIRCSQWKLHQFSFSQKIISNLEGWSGVYVIQSNDGCGQYLRFYKINYSTQLPPHKDVLIRFFKLWNSLIVNYIYGQQLITQAYQLVEILIKNHPDTSLNLKFQAYNPGQYTEIRDFEVFYSLEDVRFENWNEGCLEQINGECVICLEGWMLDEQLKNCNPICGDKLIQGQELCDDGNFIPNDGCFNCKFSCCEFCINCQFGICQECQDGFIINKDLKCEPLCGDGKVIPYSGEQCEIEIDQGQDGCKDCRFVSIANCKKNYFSQCLVCEEGYQIQENICYPYCGDQIILEQYEDCDDGNLEPFDGCYQCKFQCIEDCNICDKGKCSLKCGDGYEFIINRCLSICGDQIITKDEDCDDGNTIKYDGCHSCRYSCPLNCYDCYQGICLECNIQYLLLSSNLCQPQQNCGDGYLQEIEQCDDGNDQAADGCQNCLIEQNWICINLTIDSPSLCTYVKAPNLVVNYVNMTENKQYIRIQFDQQVKIETQKPLSETINLDLISINKTNWNSSLQIIQDVGSDVIFGEYILEIEVYQLLQFKPVLKIEVIQAVSNVDNVGLFDNAKFITLQYPKYLDKQQKHYSQNLKDINKYLIYSLAGITGISLLLGSGDLFVEILAVLQFQQYLRYINVQFPQNLEIYFSINDMITIEPILNFLQFPQIFQIINIQDSQKFAQGKFSGQNTNLLINFSSQIIQCLILLILFILLKWIKEIMYRKIFISKFFYYMQLLSQSLNRNLVLKISLKFYNVCLNLIELEKQMSFKGLQKALLLNAWDMIFKILLYTRNIQTLNYLEIIQILLLVIIIMLYITIILSIFSRNQNQIFRPVPLMQNKILRFEMLNFTRSMLFLLFLVYQQNSQIIQLGCLLLTSIFQLKIINNYRKVFEKSKYIVQMVVEFSVLIFILSSLLYTDEFSEFFDEEKKILLGWIHAIILSQGLIIELIINFYRQFVRLRQIFKNKQKVPQSVNLIFTKIENH